MRKNVLLVLLWAAISTGAADAQSLIKPEAKVWLDGYLKSWEAGHLKLGRTSMGDIVDGAQYDASFHEKWERLQVLSVKAVMYQGNWRFDGQPTPKGVALEKEAISSGITKREGFLTIKRANITDIDVVEISPHTKGADKYALVYASYAIAYSPIYVEYFKLPEQFSSRIGVVPSTKRKSKLLLKWDVFEKSWKLAAADDAGASEGFKTDNVNHTLR